MKVVWVKYMVVHFHEISRHYDLLFTEKDPPKGQPEVTSTKDDEQNEEDSVPKPVRWDTTEDSVCQGYTETQLGVAFGLFLWSCFPIKNNLGLSSCNDSSSLFDCV